MQNKLNKTIVEVKNKLSELEKEYDNHTIYDESGMITPERLYKNIQLNTSLSNYNEFLKLLISIT